MRRLDFERGYDKKAGSEQVYSFVLNTIAMPLLLPLTRSRFWSAAERIRKRQYWGHQELQRYQIERLRDILGHAASHVPYYRDRFRSMPEDAAALSSLLDLQRFPITTKADILANFPDRMTAQSLRSNDWQYIGTGGTTNRIMVVHDFDKRDLGRSGSMIVLTEDSRYKLGKRQLSIPPDACSALCGIEGFRERSVLAHVSQMVRGRRLKDAAAISDLRGLVMNNWIERARILDPFGPDGTHIGSERLDEYIAQVKEFRPTLLMGLPQYLHMWARRIRATGAKPLRVPEVRPMGALMASSVKREVEMSLGSVREHYGTRELGGVAFDCPHRLGLHVLADQFIVEGIRNGESAAPGELCTLVVTDLQNRAMPLIRYQIGDVARVHYDPCPCGRNTPRVMLEGRLEDTFVTESGRVLTPLAVCEFFYAQRGVDQFQLVERSSKWELRYVPDGDGVDEANLKVRFAEFSGDERPLQIRRASTILPEISGKFRHTKSISFERFSAVAPPNTAPDL
jgi:phenylacetate-CoA ligase